MNKQYNFMSKQNNIIISRKETMWLLNAKLVN